MCGVLSGWQGSSLGLGPGFFGFLVWFVGSFGGIVRGDQGGQLMAHQIDGVQTMSGAVLLLGGALLLAFFIWREIYASYKQKQSFEDEQAKRDLYRTAEAIARKRNETK